MFESSVVRARVASPLRRFTLTAGSILLHSVFVVGAIAASVASLAFPDQPPRESMLAPTPAVHVPPPLGTPDGGAARTIARPAPPQARPAETTTPAAIPSEIVSAEPAGQHERIGEPGAEAGPVGVPWGTDGSPGEIDAPPAIAETTEPAIYEITGEVKAPRIIHRVEPAYPNAMIRHRISATVVVRCVIDRNGRVRDPQVIASAMPPFNEAVLDAVRQWKFVPGSLRGEAVETYLELTVRFTPR